MSKLPLTINHDENKLKLSSYITGFGLSILFTISAYLLVINHAASRTVLIGLVIVFAICQFISQSFLFLHLGQENKPRWRLTIFAFMLGVVIIIVFGSLWIMHNLKYRMTIPQEIRYMKSQDNL
jgi:cytochrome o ubiquinol oxidase operon protein cyoD